MNVRLGLVSAEMVPVLIHLAATDAIVTKDSHSHQQETALVRDSCKL